MSKFKIGECYSRVDINRELHGGGLQNCLMHKNGRILAGCFKRSLNPEAPETVLIRSGEQRDAYQEMLKSNEGEFPLFLKEDDEVNDDGKNWQYYGKFQWTQIMTEARDIISFLKDKNMSEEAGNIVAVVQFQKAEFVPAYITRKKAA